ncbi:MAG: T9SS type A sorting domain-containing protein [Saprospiraceae bacterium]|nr:T9SS type A sorting domain-containing protein [Saprospiraceae bacterium]MBP7680011.1 T9SS type A sorting domain-containing protein [Saprospiraceae bacterium]
MAQVAGYKSAKLTNDADGNGIPSIGDTVTYTIHFVNSGATNITNFQITDGLGSMLTRAGSMTGSASIGSNFTLNSAYNGTTTTTMLGSGVSLIAGGYIQITLPVRILETASASTVTNQAVGSGEALSATNSDAVDADAVANDCDPPTGVTVPSGSINQTCSAGLDATTFSVPAGNTNLRGFLSVKLQNDIDGSGSVSIGDTLVYTMLYQNLGNLSINDFNIDFPLPTGLQIRSRSLSGTAGSTLSLNTAYNGTSNTTVLNSANILGANGAVTITYKVLVTSAASGLTLSTQATASGSNTVSKQTDAIDDDATINNCDPPSGITPPTGSIAQSCTIGADATLISVAAGSTDLKGYLSVKLQNDMDGNSIPSIGDTLVYTMVYRNLGNITATNFNIDFPLPTGVVLRSRSISGTGGSTLTLNTSYNGTSNTTVLNTSNTLAANGTVTITYKVVVNSVASEQTLSAQSTATSTEQTTILSDAIDADAAINNCDPPSGVTAPAGSITQSCSTGFDPVLVSIPIGSTSVEGYLSVSLKSDVDGSSDITIGDKLWYTLIYRNTGSLNVTNFNASLPLSSCLARVDTTFLSRNSGSTITMNSNYNGTTDTNLFDANSLLSAGGYVKVSLPVTILSCAAGDTISLQGTGTGTSLTTVMTDAVDKASCIIPAPDSIPYNSINQTCTAGDDSTKVAVKILLPVKMLFFKGSAASNVVVLEWATSQEINNRGFEVEHSTDGVYFSTIGMVYAKGATTRADYQFVHNNPLLSANYYRLKQLDNDGQFAFTDIVKVVLNNRWATKLAVVPNPAIDNCNVIINDVANGTYSLEIFSPTGVLLSQQNIVVANGAANVPLQTNNMRSGIYWVALQGNDKTYGTKLVIQE